MANAKTVHRNLSGIRFIGNDGSGGSESQHFRRPPNPRPLLSTYGAEAGPSAGSWLERLTARLNTITLVLVGDPKLISVAEALS